MAKKKEVWFSNDGTECRDELDALDNEYRSAFGSILDAAVDKGKSATLSITPELVTAVDALHEYAHRGDPRGTSWNDDACLEDPANAGGSAGLTLLDTQKDQPARPTLDEISELRKGDEVMISGAWFYVSHANDAEICVIFEGFLTTAFDITELVHICQGIRRRGQ